MPSTSAYSTSNRSSSFRSAAASVVREPGAKACEALPVRPEGATPRLDLTGVREMVQKPLDVGSVAALFL